MCVSVCMCECVCARVCVFLNTSICMHMATWVYNNTPMMQCSPVFSLEPSQKRLQDGPSGEKDSTILHCLFVTAMDWTGTRQIDSANTSTQSRMVSMKYGHQRLESLEQNL